MRVTLNELTVADVNENTADDMDGRIRSSLRDLIDRDQTRLQMSA